MPLEIVHGSDPETDGGRPVHLVVGPQPGTVERHGQAYHLTAQRQAGRAGRRGAASADERLQWFVQGLRALDGERFDFVHGAVPRGGHWPDYLWAIEAVLGETKDVRVHHPAPQPVGPPRVVSLKQAGVSLQQADTMYIGRAFAGIKASPLANPFGIGSVGSRAEAIRRYRDEHVPRLVASGALTVAKLEGRALACWCAPEACHGDVLVAWWRAANANKVADE